MVASREELPADNDGVILELEVDLENRENLFSSIHIYISMEFLSIYCIR